MSLHDASCESTQRGMLAAHTLKAGLPEVAARGTGRGMRAVRGRLRGVRLPRRPAPPAAS
eukprot:7384950-Pyramimonas_sp.AAC.1